MSIQAASLARFFSAEIMALRAATLAARARTGNQDLGSSVEQGLFRIEEVTYPKEKRGLAVVKPLSGFLSLQGAIAFINAL